MENIVIDVGAGAMLSWQPPLNPNGVIILYQYVINSSAVNVSANKTSDIIGNLGECAVIVLYCSVVQYPTSNLVELKCAMLYNAVLL